VAEADGIARLASYVTHRRGVGCSCRASAAEQRAVAGQLARDVTGLDLAEARRHRRSREWVIAGLHAAGWSYQRIAATFDYSQPLAVWRVVQRPAVQALLLRVREHQVEEIVSGSYGVRMGARAAAPRVAEHVVELAGGRMEADGTRRGRAARDGDCLRAGALVLGLAGHTGDPGARRRDHDPVVWLEACSETELETYATTGAVPAWVATRWGLPASTVGAGLADAPVYTEGVPGRPEAVQTGGGLGRRARALRARGRAGAR
jgi:hypothetical protein